MENLNSNSQEVLLNETEKSKLLEKLNWWIKNTEDGLRAEYPRTNIVVTVESKRLDTFKQLKANVEAGKTKDIKGVDIGEAVENAINR